MSAPLLPFLLFAVAASGTPGPNNVMVLSSAATRGLRATLPLVLGVVLGFGVMVGAVGLGLAWPLARYPAAQGVLRWVGAGWLLVLAWQVARAGDPVRPGRAGGRAHMGFRGACAFQWVNPKAWVMALATATTYAPMDGSRGGVLLLAVLFVLVGLPCVGGWALLGAGTGRLLSSPRRTRAFNVAMGALLAASVVPTLME